MTETCCDFTQLNTLNTEIAQLRQLFSRCPSCLDNAIHVRFFIHQEKITAHNWHKLCRIINSILFLDFLPQHLSSSPNNIHQSRRRVRHKRFKNEARVRHLRILCLYYDIKRCLFHCKSNLMKKTDHRRFLGFYRKKVQDLLTLLKKT